MGKVARLCVWQTKKLVEWQSWMRRLFAAAYTVSPATLRSNSAASNVSIDAMSFAFAARFARPTIN